MAARSASPNSPTPAQPAFTTFPPPAHPPQPGQQRPQPPAQRRPISPAPYGDQIITVRLHGNDEDSARKLNRTENLRPIPPGDPDFERLFPRRNDAESINRHLDDTMWLGRRPQHRPRPPAPQPHRLRHLTINSLALHRHRYADPNNRHSPPRPSARGPPTSPERALATGFNRQPPAPIKHSNRQKPGPRRLTPPLSWELQRGRLLLPIAPAPPPSGRSKTSGGCVVGRALGNGFRDFRNACGRRLWLRSAALLLGIRFRSVSGF